MPASSEPQELFVLTVGTLGDVAAILSDSENVDIPLPPPTVEELGFSASFFDAFLESRFSEAIARDTTLLAASAYYLARRPGSSLVLARRIAEVTTDSAVDKLLHWVLQAQWVNYPADAHPFFGAALGNVARLLAFHFHDGSNLAELTSSLNELRHRAYDGKNLLQFLFTSQARSGQLDLRLALELPK